ncbi:glycosyltransferase family 4 protein [Pseudoruegeria sp. SHC-113]|uniref:glycosyltransferase family 4 protein n=1 Tax=Pseudoruegeria sp. SHC-113 TaxID=2855439 RepID=UPI0021BAD997|nr:glycosyltransferase family 4 protein [Pseudoruegeria sp. SHC-113]MCT8158628.1 glycosyltransferase family 4 protein [Pseudoruegeria sp. SHC-113]
MTLDALRAVYPEYRIDAFYVLPMLKKSPLALAAAAIAAGGSYAPDLLRGRKKFKYAAFRTPWIFHWIKRQAGRVVQSGQYDFSFQMQSIFDASTTGLPHFVYTDHTHLENLNFEDFQPSSLYSKSWIELERSIYRNADMVFTRSSNVSASLHEQYNLEAQKIACVFAGSNAAKPGQLEDLPTRYSAKEILFAGIDWDRKGGPNLLAAFQKILPRHPDAKLTIVGCTPEVGQTPGCNVVGRVPLAEMPGFYERATIFCLPTRVEPFGIVFVEAMWNALPIIGTRVGAVPDMVKEAQTGFLVAPGDVDTLAQRLDTLLSDMALRKNFGQAGRRLAEDRYDWPAVAARMRGHIEETLSSRAQRGN